MKVYDFETVDVFTDGPFGGNQLAVFPDADGLSDREMQSLAAEMNYSETTFVLPPLDPGHDARLRIFNRSAEMPFAGHPNVGTAFVLGRRLAGAKSTLLFEEQAGLVEARLILEGGRVTGAEIDAPQPLAILGTIAAGDVARCARLDGREVLVSTHPPTRISVGVDFVVAEVTEQALGQASPDLAEFARVSANHPGPDPARLSLFLYHRPAEARIRCRMFAPLAGTWEDAATGSANAALAAFLCQISGRSALILDSTQGVEMHRPSRLRMRAWAEAGGFRSSVGGACAPMFTGRYGAGAL